MGWGQGGQKAGQASRSVTSAQTHRATRSVQGPGLCYTVMAGYAGSLGLSPDFLMFPREGQK